MVPPKDWLKNSLAEEAHEATGGTNCVEELIASVAAFATAQVAYNDAVKRRPGKLITLRQKARVIKKSS